MKTVTVLLVTLLLAQTPARRTLDIYVVEGGNAALFVSPSGESLLIDTGNAGVAAGPQEPPGKNVADLGSPRREST